MDPPSLLRCLSQMQRLIHSRSRNATSDLLGLTTSRLLSLGIRFSLILDSNIIAYEGASHLVAALHSNSTLTNLHLGRTDLGDDGAVLISELLEMNSTLVSVNLGECQIGDRGLQRIAQALCFNSTLSALSLSGNRMTRVQGQSFHRFFDVNSSITRLSIPFDDDLSCLVSWDCNPLFPRSVTSLVIAFVTASISF